MSDWPGKTILIKKNRLPHWTAEGATYFVTFRLADAVTPKDRWHLRRSRASHRLTDELLDESNGCCSLRDERVARVIEETLNFFDGARYVLHAYVIMPNHVHVAVRLLRPFTLEQITHTWKSFTAKQVNLLLGRTGALWQRESYDSLLQDQNDLDRVIRYIVENPIKAGLREWPWTAVLRTEFSS